MSTQRSKLTEFEAALLSAEDERRCRQETVARMFRFLTEQCPRARVALIAHVLGQHDGTQTKLARRLGISQGAVSQQLIILRKKLGQFTGRSRG